MYRKNVYKLLNEHIQNATRKSGKTKDLSHEH